MIARGVFANRKLEDIAKKIATLDIAVCDLDQCLFPGFSQIALTKFMFRSLLKNPHLSKNLKVKFKIFTAVLFMLKVKAKGFIGRHTEHMDLIRKYERIVEEIPQEYFTEAAKKIL